jgi:hypothetical protein
VVKISPETVTPALATACLCCRPYGGVQWPRRARRGCSGNIVFVPSMDSVEEMKVHTTMFDAAYGHSNGGA